MSSSVRKAAACWYRMGADSRFSTPKLTPCTDAKLGPLCVSIPSVRSSSSSGAMKGSLRSDELLSRLALELRLPRSRPRSEPVLVRRRHPSSAKGAVLATSTTASDNSGSDGMSASSSAPALTLDGGAAALRPKPNHELSVKPVLASAPGVMSSESRWACCSFVRCCIARSTRSMSRGAPNAASATIVGAATFHSTRRSCTRNNRFGLWKSMPIGSSAN
mmetsp:Transcript_15325/g.41173  ORF Transcript_15325/g.41173 Transcript_15325/m.41173 type:complete len:219 (+) Transcript_15325:1026-1682(+)